MVRVSSTASIHQLQQQCTRTAVKMAASALWGLVRQVWRPYCPAVRTFSTLTCQVLLPHDAHLMW